MTLTQKTVRLAHNLICRYKQDDIPALSAQLTYYLILSFFPFLIFVVSVIGFFNLSGDSIIQEFIRMLPSDSGRTVNSIVTEVTANRSGALLSFGMLGTFWAASNGLDAAIRGLNKAYEVQETRPYWKVKAIALLATIVLAFVILLAMLLLVFGELIGGYIFRYLNVSDSFPVFWSIIQVAVPIVALFSVFLLMYRMTPCRKMTWREVVPGSLFTTVGWIVSSYLFSFYVNHFGHFSKTYGSLGGVIVLLMWLYWSANIILLGGEINAAVALRKATPAQPQATKHAFSTPEIRRGSGATRS